MELTWDSMKVDIGDNGDESIYTDIETVVATTKRVMYEALSASETILKAQEVTALVSREAAEKRGLMTLITAS